MSLQMVIGGAGTGRLETVYRRLIEESLANPEKNFYLVVPEQYTMQTQMKMVELHPGHGVMNVDVVSFPRLAYRVFDELGGIQKTILEDTGKSMVIRRLLSEDKEQFEAFAGSVNKNGFVGQAKSMLSELFQYSVQPKQLEESRKQIGEGTVLGKKLKDIQILYEAFKEYMADTYMTSEELLDVLADRVDDARILRDSVMYIENFTGFTPAQYNLLKRLLKICERVVVGLTIDVKNKPYELGQEYQLFYLTKETLWKLKKICTDIHVEQEEDIFLETQESDSELDFLEKHIFRFHRFEPWKEQPKHIHLYALSHPVEEIRFAAAEIRRRVMQEGMSYKDFALITGDMSRYKEAARRQFSSMKMPLFVDDKASMTENSFVEMLRSSMNVILKDFSYESLFRYLRSGYTQVTSEAVDALDNYVLATGVRGRKKWSENFIKRYKKFKEDDFLRINESRMQVVQELEPLFLMSKKGTVSEYTTALRTFIANIQSEEQLNSFVEEFKESGEFTRAREYEQVFDAAMDLLDKCERILGEESVTLKEYMEILEAGFEEIKVGVIPPTLDQVVLGDLKRTRLGDVKVVFIIGCNDGVLPMPAATGGLITDREKEILAQSDMELAPTGRQNSYREKFYIYTAMTKPKLELVLTFAQMDGSGKAIRQSIILKDIQSLFPALEAEVPETWDKGRVLTSINESSLYLLEGMRHPEQRTDLWQTLFGWYAGQKDGREKLMNWISKMYDAEKTGRLSSAVIEALYGQRPRASITTLEKYAACAYAHFLSAGLKLKERETFELLPPDLGNILHQAMERFSKRVEESEWDWHTMPDQFRDKTMEACVRDAGMEYQSAVFLDNARYKYYLEQLVRMGKRTAWTIQKQICKGEFVPAGFESSFSVGEKIQLIGTVDRYDVYEGEDARAVRVVDYKSGRKEFDLTEIFYGLSIQLVVYLEAISKLEAERHPEKPVIKAGMFYYHMKDPLLNELVEDPADRDNQLASLLKMDGLVDSDLEVVKWMDAHLEETPEVIPVKLTDKGVYTKGSSVASSESIDLLGYLVHRRIEELADGWMSGDISVRPYALQKGTKKKTACDYCRYRGICHFDERIAGCNYHQLHHLSGDDVWKKIYEEVEEEWENRGPSNSSRS
ncbi:MAG: hypothetical protein EOM34_03270 [Clostridia bacterium]|nr:PD-(D/E)XK nuclease family protein [Lachnospiraceae bacterium]NCB99684.1 hypothetical protein [Clostridia bacterium]NCD01743.1 hypothetical protein [Clostridia bacterium]